MTLNLIERFGKKAEMVATSEEQKSVVMVLEDKDDFINGNNNVATFAINKKRLGLNAGGIP